MHTTRNLTRSIVFFAACVAICAVSARAEEGHKPSPEKERELIAILRSDKPKAEKALACKHLAVDGSKEAVADLAKLLSDEQLASWARIPLEAIPGPEADEALRNALGSLQGKLLAGTINSIGVRRDANAVEPLANQLSNQDVDVASAAAVALGRIGNDSAAKTLQQSLTNSNVKVRSAVAEGLVLCAERAIADGRTDNAVAIYDNVRKADVPRQRVLEATRGAILARKDEGIALLLEQFRSPEKAMFQLALTTAREFPGQRIDEALAAELPKAAPERAALLVQAMADREGTVVLPAVLAAAGGGPKPVRVAAIAALGRVGNASCLSPLLEMAIESDAEIVQSARDALAVLPGENANDQIVARLATADGKIYPLLIELVGMRRIDAVDALAKALGHSDKEVRSAAFAALGTTVSARDLSVLISQVVAPKNADDAPAAQQALKTACIRMPDREACAEELTITLDRSPLATKVVLLEILGDVGGTKALATVGAAAKSSDPELQDAGSRLLGKWATSDAAPVLLELAKSGPGNKYQIRALRGYLRIARQFAKALPEPERIEMCRNAFEASTQPAEQKLVLEALRLNPNLETLKLAVQSTREYSGLKDEATQAAFAIAQKLGDKADEVKQILASADLGKATVEIVKAEYGAGATQKDVTETVKKQAADSQLISLSSGFNDAFGGDPAPGTAKQLKIQYKLNGRAGEASFAENALIILPVPK